MAKLQYSNIESNALKVELNATMEKRGSKTAINDYRRIMDMVRNREEICAKVTKPIIEMMGGDDRIWNT